MNVGVQCEFKTNVRGCSVITKGIDRREFMGEFGLKVAGTSLLLNQLSVRPVFAGKGPVSKGKQEPAMEYRILGRTGLKVSAVSFGVMNLKEPAVLFKALDLGINYFDTAHYYQNGNAEKMLGEVLKKHGREKVYVATAIRPFHLEDNFDLYGKFRMQSSKELDETLASCLRNLQSDYVDVLLVHNIMNPEWLKTETVLAFAEQVKKDGRARFVGFSLHDPRVYLDAIGEALKTSMYDVILAWFNFKSPPENTEALRRAGRANVGVVAMKTQLGGYKTESTSQLSPQQAALKWALDQDFVSCAVPGMVNMEQLVENVGAVGKRVGWSERKTLHTYYRSIKDRYCVMCGKCSSSCRYRVDINAINRALMYCEGYREWDQGRKTYLGLSKKRSAHACLHCSSPTCQCANGIKIAERMRHAHALFA
jgi:predicted aldo/keto reductase-like oxidoreductase